MAQDEHAVGSCGAQRRSKGRSDSDRQRHGENNKKSEWDERALVAGEQRPDSAGRNSTTIVPGRRMMLWRGQKYPEFSATGTQGMPSAS